MALISLNDVESLPDIISVNNFNLNLGSIPGGGDTWQSLTLKCSDCHIPGISNEAFEVNLGPHIRLFRGRKNYGGGAHTLSVSYYEDSLLTAQAALRAWHEVVVGTQSGVSQGNIDSYSVTATLEVYDQTGAVADVCTFYHLFIDTIQDVNLSTMAAQAMQFQASFRFDYVTFANTQSL